MKNEWDFFADVQRRLASGQQLVRGYFTAAFAFPFDELRGQVLDEDGHSYELGEEYKYALNQCIQQQQTAWGLCFQERLLCVGPEVTAAPDSTDYAVAYEGRVAS